MQICYKALSRLRKAYNAYTDILHAVSSRLLKAYEGHAAAASSRLLKAYKAFTDIQIGVEWATEGILQHIQTALLQR